VTFHAASTGAKMLKRHFIVYSAIILLLYPAVVLSAPVWVVKSESNTMYLAGSIHFLRSIDLPLPIEFELAYNNSKLLVTEISMDVGQKKQKNSPECRLLENTKLNSIAHRVDKEVYLDFVNFVRDTLPEDNFEQIMRDVGRFNVEQIDYYISHRLYVAEGYKSEFGVEEILTTRLMMDFKPFSSLGLETQADKCISQLQLSSKTEKKLEEKFIREMIKKDKKMRLQEMEEQVNAWKKGNLESLEFYFDREMRNRETYKQVMLVQRNKLWLTRIDMILSGNIPTFVIVGYSHLVGSNGLIEELKNKGYIVQKLDSVEEK